MPCSVSRLTQTISATVRPEGAAGWRVGGVLRQFGGRGACLAGELMRCDAGLDPDELGKSKVEEHLAEVRVVEGRDGGEGKGGVRVRAIRVVVKSWGQAQGFRVLGIGIRAWVRFREGATRGEGLCQGVAHQAAVGPEAHVVGLDVPVQQLEAGHRLVVDIAQGLRQPGKGQAPRWG